MIALDIGKIFTDALALHLDWRRRHSRTREIWEGPAFQMSAPMERIVQGRLSVDIHVWLESHPLYYFLKKKKNGFNAHSINFRNGQKHSHICLDQF